MKVNVWIFLLLCVACQSDKSQNMEIIRTSHGIVIRNFQSPETLLLNGQKVSATPMADVLFIENSFIENKADTLIISGNKIILPAMKKPSAFLYAQIECESSNHLVKQSVTPDIELAFSATNKFLAIGTYQGYLRIYDLPNKRICFEEKISDGMVKKLAFTKDESMLIVGEQAYDGRLMAYNLSDFSLRWAFDTADIVGRSPAGGKDDIYALYSLPGLFKIEINESNEIVVAITHSWLEKGRPKKESRLMKFAIDGKILWQFPPDKNLNSSLLHFAMNNHHITFIIDEIVGNDKREYQNNECLLLDSENGKILSRKKLEALAPYFNRLQTWQSISMDESSRFVAVGAFDGRAFHIRIKDNQFESMTINPIGIPQLQQNVPISAGISFTESKNGLSFYSVNQSSIPFNYSIEHKIYQANNLHPHAGTILVLDSNAKEFARYQDGLIYSALHLSENGQYLMALLDDKRENREKSLFGFSFFKLDSHRLEKYYTFQIQTPAYFRGAISENGMIKAFAGLPDYQSEHKKIIGSYSVYIVF